MALTFQEYRAASILHVLVHVDEPWFWNKYSAHPYRGCRSVCEFCCCRDRKYGGRTDPDLFTNDSAANRLSLPRETGSSPRRTATAYPGTC
jgi:DNA repair photolyase